MGGQKAYPREFGVKLIINRRDLSSFDAVGIMKRGADNKDPYYIYRISNGLHNNSSNYVFKSSQKMAQLAVQMDIDGPPHIFQNENAYFDTTHSRMYRFKSIALWLHHPPLAKLICLANMEIRSENTNNITIFFELFNEILQKEMKNPEYKCRVVNISPEESVLACSCARHRDNKQNLNTSSEIDSL